VGTLKQVAPAMSRVAMIYHPDNPNTAFYARSFEAFARQLTIEPILAPIHGLADIERVIDSLVKKPNGGLFFAPDLTTVQLRDQIIALVAQQRIPAMYANRLMVTSGGLMSYDADALDMYRHAAAYIGRILLGEKPADLPFQEPTKFQLTINLKTAKLIGLEMPPNLIALADEVIE
jgi:putative ABC transport system substrate-binding protein